jgi:nucleoside-triphosphatase THEP1
MSNPMVSVQNLSHLNNQVSINQKRLFIGKHQSLHFQGIQETLITPKTNDEYVQPSRIQSFFDELVTGAHYIFSTLGMEDSQVRDLTIKISIAKNAGTLTAARSSFLDTLKAIDNQVREIGKFDGHIKRQAGKIMLNLQSKVAEADKPFHFFFTILNDPENLTSSDYLLTALHDHPTVALKPEGWFSQWNTRLAPAPVKGSVAGRQLLSLNLMYYLQRSSHELMITRQIFEYIADPQPYKDHVFTDEELLAMRNILTRMPAVPEANFFAKKIFEPDLETGAISPMHSKFLELPKLGNLSIDDQKKFIIYLRRDILQHERNMEAGLSLLKQALEPREKSVKGRNIVTSLEKELKTLFFTNHLLTCIKENAAGTQFLGINSIFEAIPLNFELRQEVNEALFKALEGDKDKPNISKIKPYRLLVFQLLKHQIMKDPQVTKWQTRLEAVREKYGITEDGQGYDSSNANALVTRLNESVIGLDNVKKNISNQWADYTKKIQQGKKATHPIIYLDGDNGTGKSSTIKRIAMELHTTLDKQQKISAYDYWFGDTEHTHHDNDFGITTFSLGKLGIKASITAEELQNPTSFRVLLLNIVNLLHQDLSKVENKSPQVLIIDEFSKIEVTDPQAKNIISDAISQIIYELATEGKYTVPGTNMSVSIPKETIIGLTGNASLSLIKKNLKIGQTHLSDEDLRNHIYANQRWQTPNGLKLKQLIEDKTFSSGMFLPQNASQLAENMVDQYLKYIAALKSCRLTLINKPELLKHYMDRVNDRIIAGALKPVSGREIAKEFREVLLEPISRRFFESGSDIEITYRPTEKSDKLKFDLGKGKDLKVTPPEQSLDRI